MEALREVPPSLKPLLHSPFLLIMEAVEALSLNFLYIKIEGSIGGKGAVEKVRNLPPLLPLLPSDTLGDMMTAQCWCCGYDFAPGTPHLPDHFLAQLVAEQFGSDRGPMCSDCEKAFQDWYDTEPVD